MTEHVTHQTIQEGQYVSTGSTLLNLALTDRPNAGFINGTYSLFIGDTDSGKTFVCMTCLAEAALNPAYDDYRFLLFNKERGALMDIGHFFGPAVEERLEMIYVENLEDMYYSFENEFKKGKPFIAIVDSIDAFSTKYEGEKFTEAKKAFEKGSDAKGDFGDGKAKIHSRNIRRVLSALEKSGSIIVFINQSRDNIGGGMFDPRSTHAGGRAISFYATMKLWSSAGAKLNVEFGGKKRQTGIISRIKIIRTRVTGRQHQIEIPIYHSHGIDDIGCCVDWLVSEGHWSKKRGVGIVAEDIDFQGGREKLVKYIEDNNLEFDVRDAVLDRWKEIKEATKIIRKKKYR